MNLSSTASTARRSDAACETRMLQLDNAELEYCWHGSASDAAPTLVFLHEGLGCRALWRDFPQRVASATGCGALVYSRAGYGKSSPCELPRPLDFMHREALEVLPKILAALGIGDHILVGHSDGASIALINAGEAPSPGLCGLALIAPHVFVENSGLEAIAETQRAYRNGNLRERLKRWHGDNVDCAFNGWADVWLHPDFRTWDITASLRRITVPVLTLQGTSDQYGTLAHVRAIIRETRGPASAVLLPGYGHSLYREAPEATLDALVSFIRHLRA